MASKANMLKSKIYIYFFKKMALYIKLLYISNVTGSEVYGSNNQKIRSSKL